MWMRRCIVEKFVPTFAFNIKNKKWMLSSKTLICTQSFILLPNQESLAEYDLQTESYNIDTFRL